LNRLRFAFAFAALFALATAIAACGEDDNSSQSPQAVVEKATFAGIDSGNIEFSLDVNASGKEGGDLQVSLSGPFEGGESGGTPQLDLDATAEGRMNGKDIDFEGGLVLLPNSAYVNYEGTEYEVDPTTFSFVESALNQAQRQGGAESGSSDGACEEAAEELDLASFLDNLRDEGSADVGGTSTTKLSGDLDVAGAIDAAIELSEDPACRGQLGATGALPSPQELSEARDEIKNTVKAARVELYVGDDDIVRRIVAQVTIEPKEADGPSTVDLELDLTLTGVNEDQEIAAPSESQPLTNLFQKLGVNPLELAGALQGGDIEGLLEGLGGVEGLGGGGASGGGGGAASPGGRVQSYTECIQEAASAADLQRCGAKL
jgi:hypothetical protein